MTGKKIKKTSAFSLIEIIVSLAIFSFLLTSVVTITFSMVNAQKKVQAQLFLGQSAQTTLESISRQIRYGYNYTGSTFNTFESNAKTIYINTSDFSAVSGSSATSSQNLVNAENSPFVLFEGQGGNPNTWTDQVAFCAVDGKLYKVSNFSIQTDGLTYYSSCSSGSSMLPDNIIIDKISFDIYAGSSLNPKNPMVRIKMRLRHEDSGTLDVQTTVTQRLVTYF